MSPHPTIMEGQAGFWLLPAILIMQCVVPMALWISFALETLSGQDYFCEKTMAFLTLQRDGGISLGIFQRCGSARVATAGRSVVLFTNSPYP